MTHKKQALSTLYTTVSPTQRVCTCNTLYFELYKYVEPPYIVKSRMPDNNNTCNVMFVLFMGETIY